MKIKIRWNNVKFSPRLAGQIKFLCRDLNILISPPAEITVELSKSASSHYCTIFEYVDSMGYFCTRSSIKDDPLDSFLDSLELVKDELRKREISLTDGYPSFTPLIAS